MNHTTTTPEEIWAILKETSLLIKESDRRFQETDRRLQEMSKETDRRFQEISKEADRRSQETDRKLKELSKEIGRLGNRLGEFVEGLIKPSIVSLFQQRGIEVHKVLRDVEAKNWELKLATQIDLLAVNITTCILIEVKSRLTPEDVNDHLERLEKFKPLFPEYQDKQVFGAVAGMVIADDVEKHAYRQGFFVIGQRGENAVILNDEMFKPKPW